MAKKTAPFVYPAKYWWTIVIMIVLLFFVLYQYPMIGLFNTYPGQVLKYILTLNTIYIVATAALVFILIGEPKKGG